MGEENEDLQATPSSYGTVHFEGRPATAPRMASAVVQAINEARQKPKDITAREMVPDYIHDRYVGIWQREDAALLREELREVCERRCIERDRWASLWWWQKVRETLWPKV